MKRLLTVLAIVALSMWGATAEATPYIDFGTGWAGSGGLVTSSPDGYVGTGILLGTMEAIGTANDGVYTLDPAAILNFAWGAGVGNAISITGGVSGLGVAEDTLLLSGAFTSFSFTQVGTGFAIFGTGTNVLSEALLTALGIPLDSQFNFTAFSLGTRGNVPTSTDVITSVPEPGSLLLLGAGLIGLAGVVRRRMK